MRLRSFHGNTATEAMAKVRAALGDNAIIVTTRDDEAGGVRVTAAIDDTPAAPAQSAYTAPPVASSAAATPTRKNTEDDGSDVIAVIAEALTRHQVPAYIAEKLLATATQAASDHPLVALAAALDRHFKFQPLAEDATGTPLVLIGPPGVGKTLCTAKFATKATLSNRPVTVISTDTERAGGMEQLAAFTRLLKVDLIEVEDAHALRDILPMHRDAQIFVDTPGRNPFASEERRHAEELIAACGGSATLVLPAGLDGSEAADMAQEFRAIGATRLLATRLDMARRYGSLLRAAYDAHLPMANSADSGKVIDQPRPLNGVALARLLLPPRYAHLSSASV